MNFYIILVILIEVFTWRNIPSDRSFFSDHSDIFYVGKILEITEKCWKKTSPKIRKYYKNLRYFYLSFSLLLLLRLQY